MSSENADDVLEHVAIAMPSNSGARIVAGEEDMNERVRLQAREGCGGFAERVKPARNGLSGREARILEVVAPAEALRLAIAEPAMEAEWGKFGGDEMLDERLFFGPANDLLAVAETRDQRRVEEQLIGQTAHQAATA